MFTIVYCHSLIMVLSCRVIGKLHLLCMHSMWFSPFLFDSLKTFIRVWLHCIHTAHIYQFSCHPQCHVNVAVLFPPWCGKLRACGMSEVQWECLKEKVPFLCAVIAQSIKCEAMYPGQGSVPGRNISLPHLEVFEAHLSYRPGVISLGLKVAWSLSLPLICIRELGYFSQYSVWLQTGQPRFDSWQRQSLCVQTSSKAHPASYSLGTGGPFPG
jgi:hypothetical protein